MKAVAAGAWGGFDAFDRHQAWPHPGRARHLRWLSTGGIFGWLLPGRSPGNRLPEHRGSVNASVEAGLQRPPRRLLPWLQAAWRAAIPATCPRMAAGHAGGLAYLVDGSRP